MLISSTHIEFCRLRRNRLYLSKIKSIIDHLEEQADIATVIPIMAKVKSGQEATIPLKDVLERYKYNDD